MAKGAATVDPAAEEARVIASGIDAETLRQRAYANRHERNERFYNLVEKIGHKAIIAIALIFAGIAVVYAWHLIMPGGVRWLSEHDIGQLQGILTSAVFSSVVTTYFTRRLDRRSDRDE